MTNEALQKDDVEPTLEKLYSPSQWSQRHAEYGGAAALIQAYVQQTELASEIARSSFNHECWTYGESAEERLLWFPAPKVSGQEADAADPTLVFIFVHGGYWQQLNLLGSCYMAGACHVAGAHSVVMGYELAPSATVEQQVQQVRQGLTLVMRRVAADPSIKGVYVCGHSAGAQLALMAAKELPKEVKAPDVFVLLSGVYDLRPIVWTKTNKALGLTEARAVLLSPLFCSARLPSAGYLVVMGEHDSPAFRQQANDYAKAIQQQTPDGVKRTVKLLDLPGCDHFQLTDLLTESTGILWENMAHFMKENLNLI